MGIDIDSSRVSYLQETLGVQPAAGNADMLADVGSLSGCETPGGSGCFGDLAGRWEKKHMVVSIMAGLPLSIFRSTLGRHG